MKVDLPVPQSIPRTTTLRILFTQYHDFNYVPKLSFFKVLRHFAEDEVEAEKLTEFCTTEGSVSALTITYEESFNKVHV